MVSTIYDYEELYNTAPYFLTVDEEMEDYFRTFNTEPTDEDLAIEYKIIFGDD